MIILNTSIGILIVGTQIPCGFEVVRMLSASLKKIILVILKDTRKIAWKFDDIIYV